MEIEKNHKRIINILIKEIKANYNTIIKKVSDETQIKEKWLELELKDALFALKYLPMQFEKILKDERIDVPKYKVKGVEHVIGRHHHAAVILLNGPIY